MHTTCSCCGDRHGVDQLCARAQRGMTRRSFCFLFGAGVAGLAIAGPVVAQASWPPTPSMTIAIDGVDISHYVLSIGNVDISDALREVDYFVGMKKKEPITISGYFA
jgi:hypothetical protein